MDRRSFFTRGAGEVAHAVTKHAAQKARENASRWIRPPFAIDELDFLLDCTRCNKCIDACPENIIFPLSATLGVKVFNTPAMDLLNHGCHLCEGWPCVKACETDALILPVPSINQQTRNQIEEGISNKSTDANASIRILPVISTVTIDSKTCLPYSGPECGACRICPVEGAMIWEMEKPEINPLICTGCALCREACIVEPKAINVQSKYKAKPIDST